MGAKLGALVTGRWGPPPEGGGRVASPLGGGAAIRDGATGWVLADERPERALGGALAWAHKEGVEDLHVLADHGAGVLARRATAFRRPPTVWVVAGRTLAAAEPEPFAPPMTPAPVVLEVAQPLRARDVDVVIEHGEVFGEVLGLEVARVVTDEFGTRLEVGVGRHDREAFAMLHGDLAPDDAVARVVATVREHRRPGAPSHPLNRLAAERWLRARLVAEPSLVGATELWAAESPVPRLNVKEAAPAAAVGRDQSGRSVVVVCSTGIDLDLVPAAADVRLAWAPEARLVLVVPERDAHPVTRTLADALAAPAEVVTVAGDWRAPGA